jgi:sec-independent protein translocase protein TatC
MRHFAMAKLPNDDLFESTKMSFGEHLEELRVALFRALIGVVAGFLIGLFVAGYVVEFIQSPLKNALTNYYTEKAKIKLDKEYDGKAPVEQWNLIVHQGVVPEKLTVDPERIVNALHVADPAMKIDFVPYRFTKDDVLDGQWASLCTAIASGADEEDTVAAAMWEYLTSQQRAQFEAIAKESEISADQQDQVIAALNVLIDKPQLHKTSAFESFSAATVAPNWFGFLSSSGGRSDSKVLNATLKQIRQSLSKPNATQSRRLNKLIVAESLSHDLRAPQLQTVDLRVWKPSEVTVQALGAHEVFMIWLKAGAVTGLLIASPWIFWQVWQFVAAGLYPHEKRYVAIYLPFSLILFLAGASLAFFFVFEPVLDFLFSFNRRMNIDPDPRISEWLGFVLFMPIGFGIAFQLPLVMLFINRIGIFTIEAYLEKWRVAILVICVISMLLTPADPVSMMLMAVPLTVLYFLGIALCKWMPKGRNPFAEAYEM